MSSTFPDYYAILSISETATESEIRTAYKPCSSSRPSSAPNTYVAFSRGLEMIRPCMLVARSAQRPRVLLAKDQLELGSWAEALMKQSLLTHPDRLKNATEKQRADATARFQCVADAYYVLSDPARKRAYDNQRAARQEVPGGWSADNSDSSSANFFQSFFSRGGAGFSHADDDASSSAGSESARPNAEYVFSDVFEDLLTPEVERTVPFWRWVGAGSGAVMGFIVGNLPGAAIGAYSGGKLGQIRDAKGKAVATVFMSLSADKKYSVLQSLLAKVMAQVAS